MLAPLVSGAWAGASGETRGLVAGRGLDARWEGVGGGRGWGRVPLVRGTPPAAPPAFLILFGEHGAQSTPTATSRSATWAWPGCPRARTPSRRATSSPGTPTPRPSHAADTAVRQQGMHLDQHRETTNRSEMGTMIHRRVFVAPKSSNSQCIQEHVVSAS